MSEPAGIAKIVDPHQRMMAAHEQMEKLQVDLNRLSDVRREAISELMQTGQSQAQIARLLGLSRGRISQMLTDQQAPERAFLGDSPILVAIGAKQEQGRDDPGDIVSAESFAAYELLAEAARAVGLEAVHEMVPRPGHVDLNRPNLVVLTNPRLLPFLSQVMGADPNIQYLRDDGGWYLRDLTTGLDFRSPRDKGINADYGYVGRLPRPDGKGTFLYLAGTHAQGTLGAAQYVAEHLAELYRDQKLRRFSTIVECTFDTNNGGPRIIEVNPVTPLYRHES